MMLCRVLNTFITKDGHRIRPGAVHEWEGGSKLPSYLAPIDAPVPEPDPIPTGFARPGRKSKTIHDEEIR